MSSITRYSDSLTKAEIESATDLSDGCLYKASDVVGQLLYLAAGGIAYKIMLTPSDPSLATQSVDASVIENELQVSPQARLINISALAPSEIRGISTIGMLQVMIFRNASTVDITFKHEDSNATEINRILTPLYSDFILQQGCSVWLMYDMNQSRWLIISE